MNQQQLIQDFVNCRRLAIVGVSRNGRKFGNNAYKELKRRGYQVFAVHPTQTRVAGDRCYPNLMVLKGQIDAVVISVPARQAVSVIEQASAIGIKHVWLQQGAESVETFAAAEKFGLNMISKKCVLMYAPPVGSIHRWHRSLVRLFGQL
jgi:predicted CoA-binding protein